MAEGKRLRARRFLARFAAIAGKEALHIRRDPRNLYMALAMPVLMLLLFGYGVSFDIDRIPVVVFDGDRSYASRQILDGLLAGDDLRLVRTVSEPTSLEEALRRGEAVAGIHLPAGLARASARRAPEYVQVLIDGSDVNIARQAMVKIEAKLSAATLAAALSGLGVGAPIQVRTRTLFNPAGESALFLVPGLAAYLLAIVAVLLTALTVAREWEEGSMEQLFATPVGRLEIIAGKLTPYLLLGVIQVLLVLVAGAWVFDVPFRGSAWVLGCGALLFLAGMLGQGLFVSVVTRNQMVATQAGTLSSLLPSLLLSGLIFPIENMPWILQAISSVIPARYFVATLRGVLLKGNGLAELWPNLVAMAVFAVFAVLVSTARFKREIA